VKITRTFEPDPSRASRYEERLRLYHELYPTLRDLAHKM
jgi:sugar (pentulose or hexulose) kinase